MFNVGDKLILRGISRHGKNRIAQHGINWEVRDKSNTVAFTTQPGPFLLLHSPDGDMRWIAAKDDPNFAIE